MIQPRSFLRVVVPAVLLLGGCSPTQQVQQVSIADAQADRAAVDRGHEAFLAGLRANDCNALLPVVTTNVVLAPPNTPTVSGHAGVSSWCEPIFKQVKTSALSVSDRDLDIAGDWAIEHGSFDWTVTPLAGGSPQTNLGRFIAIWHREPDGSWKLARDLWNSSVPVAALAAK